MRAQGTRFKTSAEVDTDVTFDSLESSFDAALVCTGATVRRDTTIPGREASRSSPHLRKAEAETTSPRRPGSSATRPGAGPESTCLDLDVAADSVFTRGTAVLNVKINGVNQ